MRLIAEVIRMVHAITTVQDIQDYASLLFLRRVVLCIVSLA